MGSAQSYISSEVALATLVLIGAIGLGYTQINHTPHPGRPISIVSLWILTVSGSYS